MHGQPIDGKRTLAGLLSMALTTLVPWVSPVNEPNRRYSNHKERQVERKHVEHALALLGSRNVGRRTLQSAVSRLKPRQRGQEEDHGHKYRSCRAEHTVTDELEAKDRETQGHARQILHLLLPLHVNAPYSQTNVPTGGAHSPLPLSSYAPSDAKRPVTTHEPAEQRVLPQPHPREEHESDERVSDHRRPISRKCEVKKPGNKRQTDEVLHLNDQRSFDTPATPRCQDRAHKVPGSQNQRHVTALGLHLQDGSSRPLH